MTKVIAFALAATLSGMPVMSVALAQTSTTSSSATMPAMTDDMVTIVNVEQSGTDNDNSLNQIPMEIQSATPEAMKMAQDELMKDAALMDILKKKNVEMKNVVGIREAANGGKTVYVK